jgi:hypothetical protein
VRAGISWFPYFWMFWGALVATFAFVGIWRALRTGVAYWILSLEFYRDEEPMTYWGLIVLYVVVGVGALAMLILAGPELVATFGNPK